MPTIISVRHTKISHTTLARRSRTRADAPRDGGSPSAHAQLALGPPRRRGQRPYGAGVVASVSPQPLRFQPRSSGAAPESGRRVMAPEMCGSATCEAAGRGRRERVLRPRSDMVGSDRINVTHFQHLAPAPSPSRSHAESNESLHWLSMTYKCGTNTFGGHL